MPPKPQVFKTPDGREFSTRTEWRNYMMATFYSYKNKTNESEPLVKQPGEIDGQAFDISDSSNCTFVIMDNCEQIQIDEVRSCRVFIGACASSIFIRNCSDCVFYTCSRQLRLREVTNSTFYTYSTAEVHIEYSSGVRFAPFNGGYPQHAEHLRKANLDPSRNLWYDIFDHNDPGRTRVNWSLVPESEYEQPWFPAGECEVAISRTAPGSVQAAVETNSSMQSFSMDQLIADAQAIAAASGIQVSIPSPQTPTPALAAPAVPAAVPPPPAPVTSTAPPPPPAEQAPEPTAVVEEAAAVAAEVSVPPPEPPTATEEAQPNTENA